MDKKFSNPELTLKGEKRASVSLTELKSLWFNTGTRCNLKCENCYIESSPTNDRLSYITTSDVSIYLEEIKLHELPTEYINFTGGEPFLNPQMIQILDLVLSQGFKTIVLTNAFNVINRHKDSLVELNKKYQENLKMRVSLDHYTLKVHEKERGEKTFLKTLENIKWLSDNNFEVSIAGRSLIHESNQEAINGYRGLFVDHDINLKITSDNLIIFPEMISQEDVPEITTKCWDILNVSPKSMMCSTERMIVKRKNHQTPVVLPCTLLAYDEQFELGHSLVKSDKKVFLNHEYCAKFCVLGGASCSS